MSTLKPESLLLPHQYRMADFMLARPYCAVWAGMGLYKTVSTLTALRVMLASGETERILVLAPLLVANHTWPDEIDEWEHLQGLRYARLTGPEKQRKAALKNPAAIHVLNHENLAWLWHTLGKRWPYDTVVIDESSRGYKNPKRFNQKKVPYNPDNPKQPRVRRTLTRFGAAVNFRSLPITQRVIELTGTPAPNGYKDLWSQIYLLDQGERLGRTYEMFEKRYVHVDRYSGEETMRPGAEAEIEAAIADIVMSMSEEDYLNLPERLYPVETVRLPAKVMEQYRYFKRNFVMEHHDDVEAANAGVLTNKLLQLANGSVYNDQGEDIWLHDVKLEALKRIIEEAQADGEQVLVAYSFEFDRERIRKAYPKAVFLGEDPDAIRKWKAGKAGIMVCHPAAAGHGLNLQAGGRLLVWYGLTWDLELYLQLNKRLHRGEQSRPVIIKHIVAEGTDDERVLPRLTEKNETQEGLRRAVAA